MTDLTVGIVEFLTLTNTGEGSRRRHA